MALQRRNIRELTKRKFHTQKGRKVGDRTDKYYPAEPPQNQDSKVIFGQHATKKGTFYTK
jgi:hypothetical protein